MSNDWDRVLEDRGMMNEAETQEFLALSEVYYSEHRGCCPDNCRGDRIDVPPFYGKRPLNFHPRKHSYAAFRHPDILDLLYQISMDGRIEIVPWSPNDWSQDPITVSQAHNGVYFIPGLGALSDFDNPIMRILSSHTEVGRFYSSSGHDPISYQWWKDGKCIRSIQTDPYKEPREITDFGKSLAHEPTYVDELDYVDMNRANREIGFDGQYIPPLQSIDDQALAFKLRVV